jgi:hypothetical protein
VGPGGQRHREEETEERARATVAHSPAASRYSAGVADWPRRTRARWGFGSWWWPAASWPRRVAVGNVGAPASWLLRGSRKAGIRSRASWCPRERRYAVGLAREAATRASAVRPEQSREAAARKLSCGGRDSGRKGRARRGKEGGGQGQPSRARAGRDSIGNGGSSAVPSLNTHGNGGE